MGNHHSSRTFHHPPATWTQSFPRDNRRLHKMGIITENKVLPEPIPGQRLRLTENGRSLQVAGTITGRKISQSPVQPLGHVSVGPQSLPGYRPPPKEPCPAHPNGPPVHLHAMHSASLTHLHQQCAIYNASGMEGSRSGSMHELRFGSTPSKVYTSEPDLRSGGVMPLALPQSSPRTILGQSPTKGRIKSKKKTRAPPPPIISNGALSDGYVHEHNARVNPDSSRAVHWGISDTYSRPSSQVSSNRSKSKSKKVGLFKKRHESKKFDNDCSLTDDQSRAKLRNSSSRMDQCDEKRERARSVDCLQHELRRGASPVSQGVGSFSANRSSSDESNSSFGKGMRRRCQTVQRESRAVCLADEVDNRISSTLERVARDRYHERKLIREENLHSKLEERRSSNCLPKSVMGDVREQRHGLERRASSNVPRTERYSLSKAFDEWDQAEKEVLNRKRLSDNMKQELLNVAKSINKTNYDSNILKCDSNIKREIKQNGSNHGIQDTALSVLKDEQPKTFFFGMEPKEASDSKSAVIQTITEEVKINGASVGYSKRNSELIEQHRENRKNAKGTTDNEIRDVGQKLSKDVNEFAIAIEKRKRNGFIRDDFFDNSIRREDGGYHSRQNSGSSHLENENPSDEDLGININLRPVLPKRQREIPRFSPNAAWRFLGEEPFVSEDKGNLNESRSSEEVDAVFEDKIRGFSRPVAPPRGSGEKSADSGISGDAGSPGPMQEFEHHVSNHPIKLVNGPLAVSSPVVSGRSNVRRTWTPAQDLDENSLDGSGDPPASRPVQNKSFSTPPKLTSRANMFSLFSIKENKNSNHLTNADRLLNDSAKLSTGNDLAEESKKSLNNFRKVKRSVSGSINPPNEAVVKTNGKSVQTDKWRDNWSMTRSIPNSLDNFEISKSRSNVNVELDCDQLDTLSHPYRRLHSEGGSPNMSSRSQTSFPLNGASGHIMYLPEYNSRRAPEDLILAGEISSRELNSSRHLHRYTSEQRSSAKTEGGSTSMVSRITNNALIMGRKKGNRFSYKSTVRVLEKKKIEEHLNREVAEKEKQRLREAEAMRQVEEEFKMKREREKKRLKQQLKLYQAMHRTQNSNLANDCLGSHGDTTSNLNQNQSNESCDFNCSKASNTDEIKNDASTIIINGHDTKTNVGRSGKDSADQQIYDKSFDRCRNSPRNKDIMVNRANEDTASSCMSSVSPYDEESMIGRQRPAPDGAPSSAIRADVVAASRSRNGLLTQELPEQQMPRREYKEYRRSRRSVSAVPGGISDNYRLDFSRGQTSVADKNRLMYEGRRAADVLETASSCSSVSKETSRPPGVLLTHIVRTVRGPEDQPITHVTRHYEHPPILGNLAPARPGSPYEVSSEEAYNKHVIKPSLYSHYGNFSPAPSVLKT